MFAQIRQQTVEPHPQMCRRHMIQHDETQQQPLSRVRQCWKSLQEYPLPRRQKVIVALTDDGKHLPKIDEVIEGIGKPSRFHGGSAAWI